MKILKERKCGLRIKLKIISEVKCRTNTYATGFQKGSILIEM
jgi:hypothetical protein